MKKALAAAAVVLALGAGAYALLLAHYYRVMQRPPIEFAQAWAGAPNQLRRIVPLRPLLIRARSGALNVGDRAPDFALQTPDKSRTVRLGDFGGKRPVVLVFGSYT